MSNLRNFDLNLLLAFDVLMQERNVTRAAERMFVTQSAMSHTLHRLRQQLDDPLLVKTPSGMQPTDRAIALVAPVRSLLLDMERLLGTPSVGQDLMVGFALENGEPGIQPAPLYDCRYRLHGILAAT